MDVHFGPTGLTLYPAVGNYRTLVHYKTRGLPIPLPTETMADSTLLPQRKSAPPVPKMVENRGVPLFGRSFRAGPILFVFWQLQGPCPSSIISCGFRPLSEEKNLPRRLRLVPWGPSPRSQFRILRGRVLQGLSSRPRAPLAQGLFNLAFSQAQEPHWISRRP